MTIENAPSAGMHVGVVDYEVETLLRHQEEGAAHGVSVEATHVSLHPSNPLALEPDRQRGLDDLSRNIENASKAGFRALFYNFMVLTHQRAVATTGRGGSRYSTFDLSQYDNEGLTEAGRVSREEVFERLAYFLERIIPVADENRVQMPATSMTLPHRC